MTAPSPLLSTAQASSPPCTDNDVWINIPQMAKRTIQRLICQPLSESKSFKAGQLLGKVLRNSDAKPFYLSILNANLEMV